MSDKEGQIKIDSGFHETMIIQYEQVYFKGFGYLKFECSRHFFYVIGTAIAMNNMSVSIPKKPVQLLRVNVVREYKYRKATLLAWEGEQSYQNGCVPTDTESITPSCC